MSATPVTKQQMSATPVTKQQLIDGLNEDLAREYQAIIQYVVYSQVIKGAEYQKIASELELHAAEELDHAIRIARQITYLKGTPTVTPLRANFSEDSKTMLQFDLDSENDTIANYRIRIQQAEELGEYALSEELREIIRQEQDHKIELEGALGV
jgi:bacterioferritin